ncbi:MAG: acylphosphatase [Proteobacteria bacterium]|nr:acylphosphatase [Pseudomonadota bacterium]
MKVCKRARVSGRVQGVFYRQGTLQKANALGLKGWVRNLKNGDVECMICGDEQTVEQLCQWLQQGPPAAKVSQVQIQDASWEDFDQFTILR